jgi:hypothetical protein
VCLAGVALRLGQLGLGAQVIYAIAMVLGQPVTVAIDTTYCQFQITRFDQRYRLGPKHVPRRHHVVAGVGAGLARKGDGLGPLAGRQAVGTHFGGEHRLNAERQGLASGQERAHGFLQAVNPRSRRRRAVVHKIAAKRLAGQVQRALIGEFFVNAPYDPLVVVK